MPGERTGAPTAPSQELSISSHLRRAAAWSTFYKPCSRSTFHAFQRTVDFLNATVPHICPSRTPRCDGFRSIDGMVTYPARVNGRFLHSPAPVTALSYKPSLFLCTCNHISWLFPIHLCASDQDVVHGNMNYTHNTLALPHSLEGEIQTYSASRCILSHP